MTVLTRTQKEDFLSRGFSRRQLGRIATMLTAGAALPFSSEPALAQLSRVDAPPDSVFINSNENPLGPSHDAREAAKAMVDNGGRYLFSETTKVRDLLSQQEGLPEDHVKIYPGSSNPLTWAVLAFCSPSKPYVVADPGYEAGARAAKWIGAETINVPLTKEYAHDVRAMVAASPNAGLIYICNPNNPTGTLTSQEDIAWLMANKPKGSIVMIDEAYTHITPTAPFNTAMVKDGKDVVILRTFSKIYGMAGLRAGAALGRPDLLAKVDAYCQGNGMLPITAMAAAYASLNDPKLVPDRRKRIGDVRNDTFSFLDKHNFHFVPSVSNCFMVDVKRPGGQVAAAMAKDKVVIGRVWRSWPTYVRVTVGLPDEMEKFKAAFLKVMA
ncbi:MAG TPA: pyridoxal phosphate-dependent aminotransferase [Bryobacteraceae bacterium]|jgi:histidinol-phosphate/aromatic aminotransferase/cobyric acid decarboxylase-like protein|nr:pyridoxal phosphate-dependent aminotransferase [Bryobacteraceae bacterium]